MRQPPKRETKVLLPKLAQRDKQPEIMDQPGLEITQHQTALRGLARINWISQSDGILWTPIHRLAREKSGQPLRVLDLATGGGDVPIRLSSRARRSSLPITFAGADFSSTAIDYARQQAIAQDARVDFFQLDAVRMPLPADYDIITCSLFLHHLEFDQAEVFLRRMGNAARLMVLINDLIRSRLGYLLAYVGTRVLSTSSIVHKDGPQSVRAAFTIAEARELARRAGLTGASASWRWPCRFLLEWRRP
jgi:2-polyprenyl-3-methyl-5-hydroxy-6-metoxy-1,4-benzoquinol methylase